MGYRLEAFVLNLPAASAWASRAPTLRAVRLLRDLLLVPMTPQLFRQLRSIASVENAPEVMYSDLLNFLDLDTGKWASSTAFGEAKVAYIEADIFGARGDQGGVLWSNGVPVFGPIMEERAINRTLSAFGVERSLSDEFDAVGLGRFRHTEQWLVDATELGALEP